MDGLALQHIQVEPQIAAFRRMVRDLEFDVCELAPSTYLCARAFADEFTAIPVSLARGFHHHSIVCNAESNIQRPKDLEGKKFGVRAYTVTTAVWARGILQSEYDVDPSTITWYTDDQEHVRAWAPPANVVQLPAGHSLAEMIAAGQLDAALSGAAGIGRSGPPTANWEAAAEKAAAAPAVEQVPLFPNAAALERAWYQRTRIYPIHGIIVIKNSILKQHSWVAPELLRAFQASKELQLKRLDERGAQAADDRMLLEARALIGARDPLPFGLEQNRPTFEALIEYAYQQKIIPSRPTPESVLAPNALDL
ncbi:MAG: PhnD/SsuA/transferrin family substrate-binding protein [Chloroflexi bacterium]|nr:PhnD/SsuA/transferrin family substrate-binding protein [Chloroflexota bacterium]